MTTQLFLYGAILAALLAASSHFLDRALRRLGRPTRWVWLLAMAASVLTPFAARLRPAAPPGPEMSEGFLSLEALYGVGTPSTGISPGGGDWVAWLEGPLLLLWCLGSLALVLLLAWAAQRLRREKRDWERRHVGGEEVLVSRGLGPAVVGLFRPRIVLPPWALALEEEKLDLVLRHEGEHRQARDPAILAAGSVLATAAPLNPALWWMLRRLRLAVESDCDARVLAGGIHRKRYGRFLLDAASGTLARPSLSPALVEGGSTFLERRLRMIRDAKKNPWRSAIPATLLGGFFLALACEAPTPPNPMEEEPASPVPEAATVTLQGEGVGNAPGEPLVYVDGVRVGKGAAAVAALDPREIDRIEVIKGPRATELYAEDGVDGVILIFMKGGEADDLEVPSPEGSTAVERRPGTPRKDVPTPPPGERTEQPASGSIGSGEKPVGPDTLLLSPGIVVSGFVPNQMDLDPTVHFRRVPDFPVSDTLVHALPDTLAGTAKVILRKENEGMSESAQPLVIVDGVVVDPVTWRERISPDDIERVEVIKGDAARTLYGERGANGVILITTKR